MFDYIVTTKYPKNPKHNPRDKKSGECPASESCSDRTGAHHSFMVRANHPNAIFEHYKKLDVHVTRIELSGAIAILEEN